MECIANALFLLPFVSPNFHVEYFWNYKPYVTIEHAIIGFVGKIFKIETAQISETGKWDALHCIVDKSVFAVCLSNRTHYTCTTFGLYQLTLVPMSSSLSNFTLESYRIFHFNGWMPSDVGGSFSLFFCCFRTINATMQRMCRCILWLCKNNMDFCLRRQSPSSTLSVLVVERG